jgi:Methylamine utilisation protein MauE
MTATDVAVAARVVVALVLAASGIGKLLALPRSAARFRDLGRYAWLAYLIALALPVAELLLAVALVVVDAVWPTYVAVAAFVAFTVVLVRRILRDDRRPCNCFGAASSKRAVSVGSVLRNGWFLVLAVLATGASSVHEPTAMAETIVLGAVFALISGVLVVRT